MSKERRIYELYAFVVKDASGEGVLRRVTPIGTQPLVADSLQRAGDLIPTAREAAKQLGAGFELVRFARHVTVVGLTLGEIRQAIEWTKGFTLMCDPTCGCGGIFEAVPNERATCPHCGKFWGVAPRVPLF